MREASTHQEVTALAKDIVCAPLNHPDAVAVLVSELQRAGARQVTELAGRAANAGMFDLFLEVHPDQVFSYRIGREPDGTQSQSWRWQEPAV